MKVTSEIPRPVLSEGDEGAAVAYMQSLLPHGFDGVFGSVTAEEVRIFQRTRGLFVDGVVNQATWAALEMHAPPVLPYLPVGDIVAIMFIADASDIAEYAWKDRGVAPPGYTQGMALAFAQSYLRLMQRDPGVIEMAKAETGNADDDALAFYCVDFEALGMSNHEAGIDTLRHLYMLMMGLGMRESSGKHCEGRDMSASNVTEDTAEAGLFQTSYNAHVFSPAFDPMMNAYLQGALFGFRPVFADGVKCETADWKCYGEVQSRGYKFQALCKDMPAFAVESCALTLRNGRQHYGPINRKEAELRPEANDMLLAVQDYIDVAQRIA